MKMTQEEKEKVINKLEETMEFAKKEKDFGVSLVRPTKALVQVLRQPITLYQLIFKRQAITGFILMVMMNIFKELEEKNLIKINRESNENE